MTWGSSCAHRGADDAPRRVLRSARVLRLTVVARAIAAGGRVLTDGRQVLGQRGLQFLALAALFVVVLFGSLAVIVERNEPDASIRTFGDGVWWAAATVTTVGYGDTYPRSDVGRGIGVALMIVGIALFGAITANLAAFFVEQRDDELIAEIQRLRAQIESGHSADKGNSESNASP
jgi:voltage-gated potassium channel